MLKFMRDHLGGTVLFIIVGLISLVFVLWGVFPESRFGRTMGAGGDVATIGSERITVKELHDAVERDIQNYRQLGMELPPELLNQVKAGTLNGMIQSKLMLVEAQRLGVQASEREVMEDIQSQPYFQDKDKKAFDLTTYRKILSLNGLSPGEYEKNKRDELTTKRLYTFLQSRIRVTPQEVEREYKIANETRNLEFVRFSREDALKKMSVTSKEVEEYLKTKEANVVSFYAQNNARYVKAEEVCARHILKMSMPGKDTKEAPKEFLALKPSASNFEKLAEKNSDDTESKKKGGDLGCFPKTGQMDESFQKVAFETPTGQVSAPVKSRYGWHYIYVYKRNAAVNRSLESVKKEIAEEMVKRDRLDEIRKINLASAEEAMKHFPSKAETTGNFNSLEGMIPKIGTAPEIMKAAFDPKAKIQTGPQLFEAQGGVIVARMKEKKSADMGKLAEDKDKQLATLHERKLRAFMPAWLEDVKKRTKISFNKATAGPIDEE